MWKYCLIFYHDKELKGFPPTRQEYTVLTLSVSIELPIKLDTIKPEWSIVYIWGSQVIISKTYCISFYEDLFWHIK